MNEKNNPPIIIAKNNESIYLMSIAMRGLNEDIIRIHVIDKHLPKLNFLLRILRKSFGWIETDRKRVTTMNNICLYNDLGQCKNPDVNFQGTCNEFIKNSCKHYKSKYNYKFEVNEITIEKIAAIQSLE